MTCSDPSILSVEDLSIEYRTGQRLLGRKSRLRAIDGVSLRVPRGCFLAIVGESGSGKTTLGRALLKAIPVTDGTIFYDDGEVRYDVGSLKNPYLTDYRKRVQIIFQDPYSSLSPRMTVRDIIAEPLEVMRLTSSPQETMERVREVSAACRLNEEHLSRYPHAFSGGQRQRIAIARALVSRPRVIVADESVASLDVSLKADILNLLKSIQRDQGATIILISHDLSVVACVCDYVVVLYLGQIVETGPTHGIFSAPKHPYTRALISSVLSLDPERRRSAPAIRGEIPSLMAPPPGCRFHPRCRFAADICRRDTPALSSVSPDRSVACHFPVECTLDAS